MAVPKRKTSRAKRNKRRSHWIVERPSLVECPQCHQLKPPHQVCPECGYYKKRAVLEVE